MTSPTLARLERQMKLKREQAPPAPAANSDLGAAIESLIRQAAAAGAEAAVEKQTKPNPAVPEHRREFTDKAEQHDFPPPPPQAKPPLDLTITMERDSAGKLLYATIGKDKRFEIQRNAAGRIIRAVELD